MFSACSISCYYYVYITLLLLFFLFENSSSSIVLKNTILLKESFFSLFLNFEKFFVLSSSAKLLYLFCVKILVELIKTFLLNYFIVSSYFYEI